MLRFILILLVLAISGVTYFYMSENENKPSKITSADQAESPPEKEEEYVFYELKTPAGNNINSTPTNATQPKLKPCQTDTDCKLTNQHIADTKSIVLTEAVEQQEIKPSNNSSPTSDVLNNDSIEKLINEKERPSTKKDEILDLIDELGATQRTLDSN